MGIPHTRHDGEHPGLWRWRQIWFYLFLAAVVVALYGPSIDFGLIWDDPRWYRQGEGMPIWQIMTSLPTFQFYRPLTILLNRLLVSPHGIVNARLAHAMQIGAHLAATLISVPVLRVLGFELWPARLAALVFAIHPFSYQAVAWAAPQQPLTMVLVELAILAAWGFSRRGKALYLLASLAAYGAALLSQESALPFVFVFLWLAVIRWGQARDPLERFWPLLHGSLAVIYGLIWLHVPRADGITAIRFDIKALAYLLQGIAFPVAHALAGHLASWSPFQLVGLFTVVWAALAWGLCARRKWRAALVACAWILAGILPIWAGLSWDYVNFGSRLLYPATLGIAGLWGGWMSWAMGEDRHGCLQGVGSFVLIVVIGLSLRQWYLFHRLYQVGTRHLAHTIAVLSAQPGARTLFINYPDRITLKKQPYPLGYWGLLLAPVVQELSDYAVAATGQSAETISLASFPLDAGTRAAWLYHVDLRGEYRDPEQFFEIAKGLDAIYLTLYLPNGRLALRQVGSIAQDDQAAPSVVLGERIHLVDGRVTSSFAVGRLVSLETAWRLVGRAEAGDTIFVHVLDEAGRRVEGADGDVLGGLIPMTAWQRGWLVHDRREIPVGDLPPGEYRLGLGLYNRNTGVRYPALLRDGTALENSMFLLPPFEVPASGAP